MNNQYTNEYMTQILLHFRSSLLYPLFIFIFCLNSLLALTLSFGLGGMWNIYTNVSTSMEPSIKKGDLVVVHKKNMLTYQVGDIVSYNGNYQGDNAIITHRISQIGGNVYITKGDNNPRPDSQALLPRNIIGKVVLVIPTLGLWLVHFENPLSRVFFIFVPMILIIGIELVFINTSRASKLNSDDTITSDDEKIRYDLS